jgi:hypothetical protein
MAVSLHESLSERHNLKEWNDQFCIPVNVLQMRCPVDSGEIELVSPYQCDQFKGFISTMIETSALARKQKPD